MSLVEPAGIETERLRLCPFAPGDADAARRLDSDDPEVIRFVGRPPLTDAESAGRFVAVEARAWNARDACRGRVAREGRRDARRAHASHGTTRAGQGGRFSPEAKLEADERHSKEWTLELHSTRDRQRARNQGVDSVDDGAGRSDLRLGVVLTLLF